MAIIINEPETHPFEITVEVEETAHENQLIVEDNDANDFIDFRPEARKAFTYSLIVSFRPSPIHAVLSFIMF